MNKTIIAELSLRKSITLAFFSIVFLSLIGFSCARDKDVQKDYSSEIVFEQSKEKGNTNDLRSTETIGKDAALTAHVEPIPELPGYYIHTYELPFIESDIDHEVNIVQEGNDFRTISTETGNVSQFSAFGLQSPKGLNNFVKVFGPENCTKGPNGKWRPTRRQKWPGDKFDMQFFAITGHSSSFITEKPATNGEPLPSYTVTLASDYKAQPDLISVRTNTFAGDHRAVVPLTFHHNMAAIRIIIDDVPPTGYDNVESFKIKDITFENIVKKATYNCNTDTWNAEETGNHTFSGLNKNFDGTNGRGTKLLDKEGTKEHLLFVFPQIVNNANPIMKFVCENTATDKVNNDFSKLKINLGNHIKALEANHTYVIKISLDGRAFKDHLTVNYSQTDFPAIQEEGKQRGLPFDFTVQSYREYSDGSRLRLPWRSVFKDIEGNTYSSDLPQWMMWIKKEYDGTLAENRKPLVQERGWGNLNVNQVFLSSQQKIMSGRDEIGTRALPFNLAKGAQDYSDLGTTANCYVIDAPGWYCFPLVYGNGYMDGRENIYGINRDPNFTIHDSNYQLHGAVDAGNNWIKRTYIPDHLRETYSSGSPYEDRANGSAFLRWQDVPGLIREVFRAKFNDASGQAKEYIVFYIPKSNITEGNAVIDLKERRGHSVNDRPTRDLDCIWSWHIWVTNTDIRKGITLTKSSGRKGTLLSVPMGYTGSYQAISKERLLTIKYIAGTQEQTITLTQRADKDLAIPWVEHGSYTFYQFGRKDPYSGSKGNGGNDQKIIYDQDGYRLNKQEVHVTDYHNTGYKICADYIKFAHKFGLAPTSWFSNKKGMDYANPWNWWADSSTTPKPENGNENNYPVPPPPPGTTAEMVQKTIYDPTPVGFNVAEIDIFSGLEVDHVDSRSNTVICNNGKLSDVIMYIPIGGFRNADADGAVKDFGSMAVFWLAETFYYWHQYPFYMSIYFDVFHRQQGPFEKWQHTPPNSHKDFPNAFTGCGVYAQFSRDRTSQHAPQVMPFKK